MMATHHGLPLCGHVERRGNMCSFLNKKKSVEHSSDFLMCHVIAMCRENIFRVQLMVDLKLCDNT